MKTRRNGMRVERRELLGGALGVALASACADDLAPDGSGGAGTGAGGVGGAGQGGSGQGGSGSNVAGAGGGGGSGPLFCTPTVDNIEGPYYRVDAPFLSDLTTPAIGGTRVTIRGRVLDADCQPLGGALIDVWQADEDGGYDNDGVDDPVDPATYVLRGKLVADDQGNYAVRTIIPGRYLNGAQYRPAHVHVKVSAPGQKALTTQLYFEGDPFNDIDPFILPPLIMTLQDAPNGEKLADFDFILPRN